MTLNAEVSFDTFGRIRPFSALVLAVLLRSLSVGYSYGGLLVLGNLLSYTMIFFLDLFLS